MSPGTTDRTRVVCLYLNMSWRFSVLNKNQNSLSRSLSWIVLWWWSCILLLNIFLTRSVKLWLCDEIGGQLTVNTNTISGRVETGWSNKMIMTPINSLSWRSCSTTSAHWKNYHLCLAANSKQSWFYQATCCSFFIIKKRRKCHSQLRAV